MSETTFIAPDQNASAGRDGGQPLVSVCIPVFNGEPYIAKAIESVLEQSCQDFEIIVSDNCSTDNTVRIVQGYQDPRIRIIQNDTNIGQVPNFIQVMTLAKGKYSKVLCADDWLYPDCLKVQTDILEDPANQSVVLVFCRRDIVGRNGKRFMTWGYPGRSGRRSGASIMRKCVRYASNLIGEPPCFMFRTSDLRLTGGFVDLDLFFCAKLLLHGDGYAVSEPLCAFRLSEMSTTVKEAYEGNDQARKAIRSLIQLTRTDPEYKKYGIGWVDAAIGHAMIRIMTVLRYLVYRVVAR